MRHRLTRAFASLRTRNYRLYFVGQIVSLSGQWMQTVAQSFLVLNLTHSGTVLGLSIAARFGPMFLLGPWAGTVTDRSDKYRQLVLTQSLAAMLALTFGVLVGTHTIRLWMVFVLAFALGLVNLFDTPARQAFIPELVPADQLTNAITLNSVTINVARLAGAAIGGLVAEWFGLAVCFDLNALSFVAVLTSLARMDKSQIQRSARLARARGQVRAGFTYVRREPRLLVPLVMVAIVGTLAWEFPVSLPLLAGRTFHGDAATYGAMTAVMGLGAVLGGLVSAATADSDRRSLATVAVAWGATIVIAALSPNLTAEYIVLFFVGYGSVTFNAMAKSTLQLTSVPAMRGRVMALWAMAWQGSTPVGGPIIGWIGQHLGPRWSLLIGGIPTVAVGLLAGPLLLRVRRTSPAAAAD